MRRRERAGIEVGGLDLAPKGEVGQSGANEGTQPGVGDPPLRQEGVGRRQVPALAVLRGLAAIPVGDVGRFDVEQGLAGRRDERTEEHDRGEPLVRSLGQWPRQYPRVAVEREMDLGEIFEPEELLDVAHVRRDADLGCERAAPRTLSGECRTVHVVPAGNEEPLHVTPAPSTVHGAVHEHERGQGRPPLDPREARPEG